MMLEIELNALHRLGNCSTNELYSQPFKLVGGYVIFVCICIHTGVSSVSTHVPCCTCKGKRTTSGTGPHLCHFAPSLLFAAMYIRLAGP